MNLTPAHEAIIARFRADLPEIKEGRDPYLVPIFMSEQWPTCAEILAAVSTVANVSRLSILGRKGERRVARPRQITYKLIHVLRPELSTGEIGQFMKREPSSVRYGLKVLDSLMAREPETLRIYREAKARLS